MIQEQHWLNCYRILIVDDEHHGSVMIDIPFNKKDIQADAYLWSLWVDKPYRKHGVAKRLIETAVNESKKRGCKTMSLNWDCRESETWVPEWYDRLGFQTANLNRFEMFKIKDLNETKDT